MIKLVGASRWYGQVIGLNDVTCEIEQGITALLGQNGAGKSTLIKLVTGQLKPTTGEVRVMEQNPFANDEIHANMGYCPETDSFYEEMTGRQFVSIMARMSGLHTNHIQERVATAIETVGMTERADTKIGAYSKGMRQRIKFAQAIVHNPDILVLDEPLSGLDPVGRRQLSNLLKSLANEGKTILVSSHILHEVEQMTNKILLLHRGRLLARGDIREIRSLIDKHPHRVRVSVDNAREICPRLISLPSVLSIQLDRNDTTLVELETNDPDNFYSDFSTLVLETGANVRSLLSPDNNLEAVFAYLVQG